jgi:hypothetical protein
VRADDSRPASRASAAPSSALCRALSRLSSSIRSKSVTPNDPKLAVVLVIRSPNGSQTVRTTAGSPLKRSPARAIAAWRHLSRRSRSGSLRRRRSFAPANHKGSVAAPKCAHEIGHDRIDRAVRRKHHPLVAWNFVYGSHRRAAPLTPRQSRPTPGPSQARVRSPAVAGVVPELCRARRRSVPASRTPPGTRDGRRHAERSVDDDNRVGWGAWPRRRGAAAADRVTSDAQRAVHARCMYVAELGPVDLLRAALAWCTRCRLLADDVGVERLRAAATASAAAS